MESNNLSFYGETEFPIVKLLKNHLRCLEEEYHVVILFQKAEGQSGTNGKIAVNYENLPDDERNKVHQIMESLLPALLAYGQQEYIEQQLSKQKSDKRDDLLTGVFNREYLINRADILKRAEIYPTTVVAARIKGWKNVVENYGTQSGDSMVQLAAAILGTAADKDYLIGRMEEDTFVILIPLVREGELDSYLERVEKECRAYENSLFALRMDFGITATQTKNEDINEKIEEAIKKIS